MNPKLPDALIATLSSQLEFSKSRLRTLAYLIIGMVNVRCSQEIGQGGNVYSAG